MVNDKLWNKKNHIAHYKQNYTNINYFITKNKSSTHLSLYCIMSILSLEICKNIQVIALYIYLESIC